MAIEFGKGITLAGGFDLGAKSPLDSRLVVATIEDRDAHVTGNRAYEGMLVYVESDKITYQYVSDAEGNLSWKEFGFNEADFMAHVANDLVTDDAEKVLSAKQGVALKALIDAEIERAGDSEEALQAAIDELEAYVGTIPDGYDSTNLISYINKKAQEVLDSATGGSSESAASVKLALETYIAENNPKVAANTENVGKAQAAADKAQDEIDALEETYATDKAALDAKDAELASAIATEKARAEGIESGLEDRIETMEAFWKAAQADGTDSNVIDTLKEIQEYIAGDESGASEMAASIKQNADDIDAVEGRMDTAEGAIEGLQGDVEGINAALDTKVEKSVYDAKVEELADADEAMAGRLDAIEAKLGESEDSVDELIASAVAAEKSEREAADALKADKSVVDGIDGRVGTLEGEMAQAKTDIETVEAAVATKAEQSALDTEVAAREALDARVSANEGKAHTHANAAELAKIADGDVAKWNAIEENANAYTDAEINKVEAVIGDIESGKTVIGLLAEMRQACEAGETQAIADANAYTDGKIKAVNDVIGEVESGKTVMQLLAAARTGAETTAAAYTDAEIAKVTAAVTTLSEAHAADKLALEGADTALANRATELESKVAALEAVEHVEISESDINALFPNA